MSTQSHNPRVKFQAHEFQRSPARKQAARPSSKDYQKVCIGVCRNQIEDLSMSSMSAEKMENVLMSETLP